MQRRVVSAAFLASALIGAPAALSAAVKVVTPVQTGAGTPGTNAAGAVSGPAGAGGGIAVSLTPSAIGQTTLINVNTPGVEVSAAAGVFIQSGGFAPERALALPEAAGSDSRARAASGEASGERVSEGERSAGVDKLETAMRDLTAAKAGEKKDAPAAVSGRLDALFDFSKSRKTEDFKARPSGKDGEEAASSQDGAAAVKGSAGGTEKSAEKIAALAANAESLDAPFLYQRAADLARESGAGAKAAIILGDAAKRARVSLTEAGNKAFIAAAKGRTTDALNYTRSVYGWHALLSSEGRPLISNFSEFKDAVKHVLGEALQSPGRSLPTPTVKFEAGAGGFKALVSIPDGIRNQVAPVPATLAADLALPEALAAAADVPGLGEGFGLAANFDLASRAGFRALYRKYRGEGRSVLEGFWLAARRYLSGMAAGLWERLRVLIVSFLRAVGLSASPSGTVVDVSAAAVRLRALPARELSYGGDGDRAADGYGLGYKLYPVVR